MIKIKSEFRIKVSEIRSEVKKNVASIVGTSVIQKL